MSKVVTQIDESYMSSQLPLLCIVIPAVSEAKSAFCQRRVSQLCFRGFLRLILRVCSVPSANPDTITEE